MAKAIHFKCDIADTSLRPTLQSLTPRKELGVRGTGIYLKIKLAPWLAAGFTYTKPRKVPHTMEARFQTLKLKTDLVSRIPLG